jgi:hypothetical protein
MLLKLFATFWKVLLTVFRRNLGISSKNLFSHSACDKATADTNVLEYTMLIHIVLEYAMLSFFLKYTCWFH